MHKQIGHSSKLDLGSGGVIHGGSSPQPAQHGSQ